MTQTISKGLLILGIGIGCGSGIWAWAYSKPYEAVILHPVTQIATQPGDSANPMLAMGKALYDRHCASCHGDKGDGLGIAAPFLYPKPRNFQEGKFKVISTINRIPTDEDLMQVITNGMPGSIMVAFGHLSDMERKTLVQYVRELSRLGIEQRLKKAYEDAGDEVDLQQIKKESVRQTTPGDLISLPTDMPKEEQASVLRGRALYMANCATCHGETGRGEGGKDQRDDDGTPTKPRDFTLGIFKGGRDVASLYRRTQIGMPGTPMPGSPQLKPTEIMDMVHFIRSLAPESAMKQVQFKREALVARRVADLNRVDWQQVPSTFVVTAPLWWRDWQPPHLQVQMVHDGKQLAVRMSWNDSTKNDSILRPEDFEDQASLQLFDGQNEPFIGMGAHGFGVVDIWLWKASHAVDQTASKHILDDYPFDLPFYQQLLKRLPKSDRPIPDFITARAAKNQNSASANGNNASNLMAQGPGSTTFRPLSSQVVNAHAKYESGQWSVVFTRPLQVQNNEGVLLNSGKKCFIAFSIWDGAYRDRNGQKQISIWHELTVE